MRIIQFRNAEGNRAVGLVQGDLVDELQGSRSVYELAGKSLEDGRSFRDHVDELERGPAHDYDALLREKRVLFPLDHPDPAHLLVTGTGLTHLGSAKTRQELHQKKGDPEEMTDSMRMFRMGLEGGKPNLGVIGAQPEWFYKGDGSILAPPEGDLIQPWYALDGGEEAEICGLYLIDRDGVPRRLGFSLGNEFSDHTMENQNYLYLAHSKLRPCSLGPELLLDEIPVKVEGRVTLWRNEEKLWESKFETGEGNMSHSIQNLEHHQFKYAQFRRPGDLHIHYMGTGVLSYGNGVRTADGDLFELECPPFGKPLRNRLRYENCASEPVEVMPL